MSKMKLDRLTTTLFGFKLDTLRKRNHRNCKQNTLTHSINDKIIHNEQNAVSKQRVYVSEFTWNGRFGPKVRRIETNSGLLNSASQNVLKSDLQKSRICPILDLI